MPPHAFALPEGLARSAFERRISDGDQAFEFEPQLLRDVPASNRLACEEVFGPVVSVSVYDDVNVEDPLSNDRIGIDTPIFFRSRRLPGSVASRISPRSTARCSSSAPCPRCA